MAVVFPYVKNTTWANDAGGATPITAAKLNVMEDGMFNAHQQPAVRVFHNANQSITNSTDTTVAFNSERFDQAGGSSSTQHDTVTNNGRLTCLYAGIYQITGTVQFDANSTGYRSTFIRLNGTTEIATVVMLAVTSPVPTVSTVTTLYSLAVNDYVELRVTQNSGGALNIMTSGNRSPEFMMVRVG